MEDIRAWIEEVHGLGGAVLVLDAGESDLLEAVLTQAILDHDLFRNQKDLLRSMLEQVQRA